MRGLKEVKYNGQTNAEFEKNKLRVSDIWIKSDGDAEKAKSLSTSQANRITDEFKALNRAFAVDGNGNELPTPFTKEEIRDVRINIINGDNLK